MTGLLRHIVFYLNLLIIGSAFAGDPVLTEFKTYLTSLQSVAIDFKQEDSRGASASGKLVIVKPDKFLCNYYAPYPLVIVGNKSYVSVYDFDLEQLSRIKTADNMFNFLLTDSGDIEKNFHVNKAARMSGYVEIELYHTELDRTTTVIVKLPEYRLQSIITDEADGNIITLHIENIQTIKGVDKELFILRNPDVYGVPTRMDKKVIEKKYSL